MVFHNIFRDEPKNSLDSLSEKKHPPNGKVKSQEVVQQIYFESRRYRTFVIILSSPLLHEIFLDRMEKTIASIARPIEVQDHHKLCFPLFIVRFEGGEKGLGLVKVESKEGVRKDWSGFRRLE